MGDERCVPLALSINKKKRYTGGEDNKYTLKRYIYYSPLCYAEDEYYREEGQHAVYTGGGALLYGA